MLRVFEILTGIGAVCAAILLFIAFASGMSAPQQGAAAAIAIGLVVVPYCWTGVLQRRAMIAQARPEPPPGSKKAKAMSKLKLEPLDF